MKTLADILPFAATVEREYLAQYIANHGDSDFARRDSKTVVHMAKKYARVDVGTCGKYMVDLATGEIFGIKAYGCIHRGHRYGTLDTIAEWNWSQYHAFKRPTVVCGCHRGSTCDIGHDPATCECAQCTTATRKASVARN